MPTALVNDVELYYEEHGTGEALIWSHEYAGDYRSWAPQVRALARRYRVITYSNRGYLPSGVPTDPAAYSQEQLVEDLRGLLDHLGIARAHVGGLSMGGSVALIFSLTYPERCECISPKLDWQSRFDLHFEPPDLDAFPALRLGFEVAARGGTCGAVLNAANEKAVERFLAGNLGFCDIPRACRAVLDQHHFDPTPTLSELLRLDRWAREETSRWT